jgi:hypothetical protein
MAAGVPIISQPLFLHSHTNGMINLPEMRPRKQKCIIILKIFAGFVKQKTGRESRWHLLLSTMWHLVLSFLSEELSTVPGSLDRKGGGRVQEGTETRDF